MRALTTLIFVLSMSIAQAQNTYNLTLQNVKGNIYQSLSGVVLILDNSCEVNDVFSFMTVQLNYYGNPEGSSVGPLFDNIVYEDWIGDTYECGVYDTAMLKDGGITPIESFSTIAWDDDNKVLHLNGIEVWSRGVFTGLIFSYARLNWHSMQGNFTLEELEE